jgi:hypothetical protein
MRRQEKGHVWRTFRPSIVAHEKWHFPTYNDIINLAETICRIEYLSLMLETIHFVESLERRMGHFQHNSYFCCARRELPFTMCIATILCLRQRLRQIKFGDDNSHDAVHGNADGTTEVQYKYSTVQYDDNNNTNHSHRTPTVPCIHSIDCDWHDRYLHLSLFLSFLHIVRCSHSSFLGSREDRQKYVVVALEKQNVFLSQQQQQQPPPKDNYSKTQKPKTKSFTHVWFLLLCAVAAYAICRLDLSILSLTSVAGEERAGVKKPILQISVLGERNSGTRWTWG